MGKYKCCECGSDLGLKETTEIACPKCDGFEAAVDSHVTMESVMAAAPWYETLDWDGAPYRKPIKHEPAAMGDVWTTDPPKSLGWYKVILGDDEKSMACVTSIDPNGDVVWSTVGPFNQLHIGVSSKAYSNQMVNFWGEKVL